MKPAALLWDYDGTLVDSAVKNRLVTIELLHRFDETIEQHLPTALRSVQAYRAANIRWKNWRELYKEEYGLTESQIDEAGRLWSGYQIADPVLPPLFCGLRDVLPQLASLAPMGICSQNGSKNISSTLHRYGVSDCFGAIIGHEEVPFTRQKPDPAGYLACLEQLGVRGDEGLLFYIGDHREDVNFARAAAEELKARGIAAKMVCITVRFGDKLCLTEPTGAEDCAAEPEELPQVIARWCGEKTFLL